MPIRTALCVGQWLPASETFIYDQLIHQKRTRLHIIARDRTKHAKRFPYDEIVHLGRLEQIAYYHSGWSHRVPRTLKRQRTQIIHAHFGLNGAMVLPVAQKLKIPLVVSFHGHDVGGLEEQNRKSLRYFRYQKLAPALFSYAEMLLCASTELAESLVEHGAPPEKVRVHHLGVDIDAFTPPNDEARDGHRLLVVGRLVEKKGIDDALRAFAQISGRFPFARLIVVGEGELRAPLVRLAKSLGLSGRVDFRGALTSAEVLIEMRRSSLLLTPSFTTSRGDRESGVIVVKEGGATGLPTVATHHGGLPEIIEEGKTGFLVGERDVNALADRLQRLLGSATLRREMGSCARLRIERLYNTRVQNEVLEEHLVRSAHVVC